MNKSLNYSFRNKQIETIDKEHSKLLKRLEDKKSKYQAWKLLETKIVMEEAKRSDQKYRSFSVYHQRWIKESKKKDFIEGNLTQLNKERKKMIDLLQLTRIRKINSVNLIISLRMDQQKLQIFGKDQTNNYLKTLEIPKEEALQLIQKQCDGKLENIFDHLHYIPQQQILQLIPKHQFKTSRIDEQIIKEQTKI